MVAPDGGVGEENGSGQVPGVKEDERDLKAAKHRDTVTFGWLHTNCSIGTHAWEMPSAGSHTKKSA